MNLRNMMQKKYLLTNFLIMLTALSVFFMINMVGLLQFNVHADTLSDIYLTATPSSCSVGDTITLAVYNASSGSMYSYTSIINGHEHSLTGYIYDSVYYYTPVESGTYKFYVSIIPSSDDPLITVYSNSVVVSSSDESSEPESSEPESSEPESSEPESSISLPFLPSDWEGGGFVQPSAESTPDLSYEDLPSDLEAFEVSEDLTQIIGKAFDAFPQKLIVLMIPTVICLFIGWWLHK